MFFDEHIHLAARAWFTFRYFGFKRVYVLDGGFNKWHHQHDFDKNDCKVYEDLNLCIINLYLKRINQKIKLQH